MGEGNKRILVISAEKWGKVLLSKHHYAIELVRQGHDVWFLEPPSGLTGSRDRIRSRKDGETLGVTVVSHHLFFPEKLKFHFWRGFIFLMRYQVKAILAHIGVRPDVVLSFDLQGHMPLRYFPDTAKKIYFPVDEPFIPRSLDAARTCDGLISITKEILEKFRDFGCPKLLLNHGVSEEFLNVPLRKRDPGMGLKVGMSGNFLRHDIDRDTMLDVIRENPQVTFECWGSIDPARSNIGGQDGEETRSFVNALKSSPNVVLHGIVGKHALAEGYADMDAFLICYDIQKDHSKGTNYHKIMEFLSNGKVIISNNVTAYAQGGSMLAMTKDRTSNRELPGLFKAVINDLETWNAPELVEERRSFARNNSYAEQVNRVNAFLDTIDKPR